MKQIQHKFEVGGDLTYALAKNTASNLDQGSKTCPLVSELRKIKEEIGGGSVGDNSGMMAIKAGLLTLYTVPMAAGPGNAKVASAISSLGKIAAASTLGFPLTNSIRSDDSSKIGAACS